MEGIFFLTGGGSPKGNLRRKTEKQVFQKGMTRKKGKQKERQPSWETKNRKQRASREAKPNTHLLKSP